jgi:hypothetical protein
LILLNYYPKVTCFAPDLVQISEKIKGKSPSLDAALDRGILVAGG